MKKKFKYLGSGNNGEDFNRLIKERDVIGGFGYRIKSKFKKFLDFTIWKVLNCKCYNFKDEKIKYFANLMIMSENIEWIFFKSIINNLL